jgi:branched-chain amino acid transport system permease protein
MTDRARQARQTLMLAGTLIGAVAIGQLLSIAFTSGHRMIPFAVQAQSALLGTSSVLYALGIVLVYRSSRIINFAHAGFGALASVMLLLLVRELHWPYLPTLLLCLVGAAVLGAVIEVVLLRRFFGSARLVLTVVTIGVAQALQFFTGWIPSRFGDRVVGTGRIDSPFSKTKVTWSRVLFTGDHLALAIAMVAVVTAMALFFRYSALGIAIRGAAENDDRAQLLGVNVRSLTTVVWASAAFLSALGTALLVPISGAPAPALAGVGSGLLLRALAAAVFARLESLPAAAVAALSIAVFEQSIFYAFGRSDISDGFVFIAILGGLLLQRAKLARSQHAESGAWAASEEIRPVPEELAGLASVRRAGRRLALVGAVLVLGYPWVASPSQTNSGSLYAIYGIIAVSLVILTGWGGQISLGQWGLAAVGAFVGGALTSRAHLPFPVALVGAAAAGGVAAILLGLPALRIRGLFLAVTTLAFSVVASGVLLSRRVFGDYIPDVVRRPKLLFINTEDERAYYYVCLAGLALALFVAQGLRRSRTGRVLIAMRDNERAAQAFGISLVRTRLATFAISGALAAFAGALFAHHQHAVTQEAFAPAESVQMFLMAVIGGLGSVGGVLLGPLLIGIVSTFFGDYRLLASAAGLLFVLLLAPGGFGSLAFGLRDSYLRRLAIRHKIFVPSLLADHRVSDAEGLAKVPLTEKTDDNGMPVTIPPKYRLPSRIGATGRSQGKKVWTLS